MIFNTDNYYDGPVAPSPYPVGLEGALMHVYENECNYNALMKAVGISELKYYQETGKNLFVHEAGAFAGFLSKAKAFFKKVIEKIKQIFHKFAAVMNQFTMSDKKFVKQYSKEINRKDISDFTFSGYTFEGLDTAVNASIDTEDKYKLDNFDDNRRRSLRTNSDYQKDSDGNNDFIEEKRGGWLKNITGKDHGSLDESEFRDELKDFLYGNGGEKEELNDKQIDKRKILQWIEGTDKAIKDAERKQRDCTRAIDKYIKKVEEFEKEINKKDATYSSAGISLTQLSFGDDPAVAGNKKIGADADTYQKGINNYIAQMKAESNDIVIFFGMLTGALKDRNRQSKAICVKIIGYNKKESANYGYYGESSVDDLFAGVTIR